MTEEMKIGNEVGNVIWFDQKKGYGFVKIINPGSKFLNNEIFVHFSTINSESSFKKLFPGENVSLDVEENPDETSDKKFISKNVTGLFGSSLMVDNPRYQFKVISRRVRETESEPEPEPEPELEQ